MYAIDFTVIGMEEIKIRGAEEGATILILAGVHGDEYEPVLAALELAVVLEGKLKKGSVHIIPVVNESAHRLGQRCGDDGLDLARICPGSAIGSSTLRDAAEVSQHIKNCDYLIDLHTGGGLFDIFPLAGYMLHPDEQVLDMQRKMANAFGLPLVWGTDPAPEGRTLSIARDTHKPAIYVEYGGPGPVKEAVVQAYVQGCLNVLQLFGMLSHIQSETKAPVYVVEDGSEGSGYLQGKMLAPVGGVFVPKVKVGSDVKNGQLWGVIHTGTPKTYHEVHADRDGLALFVRCQPKVQKQESLGGIISWNSK